MRQKPADFTSIRTIVREVVKDLETRSGDAACQVEEIWHQEVGDELAALARVSTVSAREVEIEAESSAVLAEVKGFHGAAFLRRLREEGVGDIERISFRLTDG